MSQAVQDTSPVVQTMDVQATPERVFSLWTEPEELVRWWPEAAVFEPRVGGEVRLEFKQGNVTGEVTRFAPPNGSASRGSATTSPSTRPRWTSRSPTSVTGALASS